MILGGEDYQQHNHSKHRCSSPVAVILEDEELLAIDFLISIHVLEFARYLVAITVIAVIIVIIAIIVTIMGSIAVVVTIVRIGIITQRIAQVGGAMSCIGSPFWGLLPCKCSSLETQHHIAVRDSTNMKISVTGPSKCVASTPWSNAS